MRPCRARARMHVNLQKIPQWLYNWDMLVDVMRGCLNKKRLLMIYFGLKGRVELQQYYCWYIFYSWIRRKFFFLVHSEFKAGLGLLVWMGNSKLGFTAVHKVVVVHLLYFMLIHSVFFNFFFLILLTRWRVHSNLKFWNIRVLVVLFQAQSLEPVKSTAFEENMRNCR